MQKHTSLYYLLLLAASHFLFVVLDYLNPPRPNFYVGFQLRYMDALYLWITLSVSVQVGYDANRVPDNLSLIYCCVGAFFLVFIVYFWEKRRCLAFLSADFGRLRLDHRASQYVFSLLLLVERGTDDYYRDLLCCALSGLLAHCRKLPELVGIVPELQEVLRSGTSSKCSLTQNNNTPSSRPSVAQ